MVCPLNPVLKVMLERVLSRLLNLLALEITVFVFNQIECANSVVASLLVKAKISIVIIVMTKCLNCLRATVWAPKSLVVVWVTF